MEEIVAYKPKCGCKKKTYRTKHACLEHERKCIYNPDNKSCPTCKHDVREVGCPYSVCELNILKYNSLEEYDKYMENKVSNIEFFKAHCTYWELKNKEL